MTSQAGARRIGLIRASAALMVAAGLAACSSTQAGSSSGASLEATAATTSVQLTVFGAASLRNALEAVKTAYEAATPGVTLTIATDSSATLRTQIEQGAPADVFLSADQKNPRTLADAGLTDGPPVDFAGNRLTIVVPADNPGGVHSPLDLARPKLRVVAAGADVPITGYAEQVVAKLGALPGYPAGFAGTYEANVVSREQNVQAVVAKIELGEAKRKAVARRLEPVSPRTARALVAYTWTPDLF